MGTITRGYNRWPRNWPREVPLYVRWPERMNGTSSWPWQYKVTVTYLGDSEPPPYPTESLGHFVNLVNGVMTWDLRPTIADPSTGVLLHRQVGKNEFGNWAIANRLEFYGLHENDYSTKGSLTNYSFDDASQILQTERKFDILYDRVQPVPIFFNFIMHGEKLDYCGQEWPPPLAD